MHQLPQDPPGTTAGRTPGGRNGLDGQRARLHHPAGGPLDPANLTRRFGRLLDRAELRRIRFHDLRHSTATLLLEQGVDLVVIKELLGHAHTGVTAGVYAHVRLRLQRQAIDTLGSILGPIDAPDDPPTATDVR
jgi:integrase